MKMLVRRFAGKYWSSLTSNKQMLQEFHVCQFVSLHGDGFGLLSAPHL